MTRTPVLISCAFIVLQCTQISYGAPSNRPVLRNENGFFPIGPNPYSSGEYSKAAVASSSKTCSEIGIKMLKKGGSAVDAAIATLLCDGVISLQGMGIGGGFLMTIWDANKQKAYFLNAREYAPAAAYETVFTPKNKDDSHLGAKSIAVPGEIAGYWAAHQEFGKLPWKDLFEDSIRLCKEGSDVSRYVANDVRKIAKNLTDTRFLSLKNILRKSHRHLDLVDINDKIARAQLAETLKTISEGGQEVFYNGTIAKNLVNEIQAAGGFITENDFKNYRVEWKEPVNTTIHGKLMYSAPTPGSGAVLFFILNVLEKLIPASNEKVMWQYIAETFKWGYARRNELGDFVDRPEYVDKHITNDCRIPQEQVESRYNEGYEILQREEKSWDKDCLMSVAFRKLLSKEYANEIRKMVEDASKTHNDYEHYKITKEGRIDLGTAHTSVYAEDGSAVSVTSTINHVMGSLIRSPSTGIILNNEMDDYSYPGIISGFGLEPSEFNFVRNRSSTLRPMSSMSPTIILNEDKTVRLIIGSAGGTKITTGVAQGIIRNLFLGQSIKESIDAPRIHHNLWPMALQLEPGFDPEIVKYLNKTVEHAISDWLIMQNTMAAVAVNGPNNVTASGDYRREGGTGGY